MYLSPEQERTLSGERGEAKELAMTILAKVGEALGADTLVPIKSAHVLAHYSSLHEAGIEVLEKFSSSGGRFAVPTTVDAASVDLENWKSFGIPEEDAEKQFRLCAAFARLGGIPCWSCAQYQVCNFPKAGETVAWAESNSVVFANSLIGCRTNKITSGLDIACAITGLTPRFGMLLDENRRARGAVRATIDRPTALPYPGVRYNNGRHPGPRGPWRDGLPRDVSSDHL